MNEGREGGRKRKTKRREINKCGSVKVEKEGSKRGGGGGGGGGELIKQVETIE